MAGITNLTSANAIAFSRKIISAKYRAHARDKRRPISRAALRLREFERIFADRYGRYLPDDDAGRDDLWLAFNQIPGIEACVEWARIWAPWLPHDDAMALAEQITATPRWPKARAMGEQLGLTDAERKALNIRTIRPIDVTDAELIERSKQVKRDRKALKRKIARAAKPAPASQTKPWESEGINRATWYRRKAKSTGKQRATKHVPHNTVSFTGDRNSRTTPPANAVGTTYPKSIRLEVVDGAAGVGNTSRRFKTRFPTSMRLSKAARTYALESGFEPQKIESMFAIFRLFNVGKRSYSADWDEVWLNWVDREVDIYNENCDRQEKRRRRDQWFDRLAG